MDSGEGGDSAKSKPRGQYADAILEVKKSVGPKVRICILGGTAFRGEDSEALVKAIAEGSAKRLGERAAYVTGGMAGVQQTFASSCGDGSQVYNLLPQGESSNYGVGKDLNAGANLDERKEIFGLLGHIYLTVEGGPGVAMEAKTAFERGAAIVPLVRTGGASSGLMDFPAGALEKPSYATAEEWELLKNKDASVADTAEATVSIVARLMAESAKSTMVITAQKKAPFYMGALASFLRGTTDKMPVEELTITAVGSAISTAVSVAARAEMEELGKIVQVSTDMLANGADEETAADEAEGKEAAEEGGPRARRSRGGPRICIVMKQGAKTC